jgi:glycopeptide antibiotics resistance protein
LSFKFSWNLVFGFWNLMYGVASTQYDPFDIIANGIGALAAILTYKPLSRSRKINKSLAVTGFGYWDMNIEI